MPTFLQRSLYNTSSLLEDINSQDKLVQIYEGMMPQASLFNTQQYSDFVLRFPSSGATLYLHKAIVCPCSDFFKACFQSGMQEQARSRIEADADDDADLYTQLLQSCYDHSIHAPRDENKLVQLILLAQKYQFKEVEEVLENELVSRISEHSESIVALLLNAPDMLKMERPKQRVRTVIFTGWQRVMDAHNEELQQLSLDTLCFLLDAAFYSREQSKRMPSLIKCIEK